MKKLLNLQLFADEPAADQQPAEEPAADQQPDKQPEAKYTDADLDRILDQKFAEWSKKKDKAVDEARTKEREAAKLERMNAQQKAEYERDQLKKELDSYKKKDALAEMMKTSRKMLADKNINVSDDLLSTMVTTDAEETKAAIDSFAKLFEEAVDGRVKERLRGETPRAGSGTGNPVSEVEKRIKKYV